MRILLTGAGTGGHIYPLIAVAKELREQVPRIDLMYIGTHMQMGHLADEVMKQEGIPIKYISAGKLRRYFSVHYFLDFFRVPFAIVQSLWHLLFFMPDAVFSKGGYASVPVVIAAWIYRIPVMTHESDAVPGWANRINGKFSYYIALSFPEATRYFEEGKAILTGSPIREELHLGNAQSARQRWGLSEEWPTLLVMGGSQGAEKINDAIVRILPKLTRRMQVIHMTGEKNFEHVRVEAARQGFKTNDPRYVALPFLSQEEMADAYAVADLAVSRAGANSIAELGANGVPSILVPIEAAANNHQCLNAYSVAKHGGGVVMEESNLGKNLLLDKIEDVLSNEVLRTEFSSGIKIFYHEDAIKKIVAGIFHMTKS